MITIDRLLCPIGVIASVKIFIEWMCIDFAWTDTWNLEMTQAWLSYYPMRGEEKLMASYNCSLQFSNPVERHRINGLGWTCLRCKLCSSGDVVYTFKEIIHGDFMKYSFGLVVLFS